MKLIQNSSVALILLAASLSLRAGTVTVPNYSFESPVTPFADPRIDSWQQIPEPPNQTSGVFLNTPSGSSDHINNCDGNQAAFLFSAILEIGMVSGLSGP